MQKASGLLRSQSLGTTLGKLAAAAMADRFLKKGASGSAEEDLEAKLEQLKCKVAAFAVEKHVTSGQIVGVGTGSTARYVVDALAERTSCGLLADLICVPTSFQARHLIIGADLALSDLERHPVIDICIDGADEVDPQLNCIKGGGGCLTQEKVVQSCARRFVIVADYRKKSDCLGDRFPRLPLEVVPAAYVPVKRRVQQQEGTLNRISICNLTTKTSLIRSITMCKRQRHRRPTHPRHFQV